MQLGEGNWLFTGRVPLLIALKFIESTGKHGGVAWERQSPDWLLAKRQSGDWRSQGKSTLLPIPHPQDHKNMQDRQQSKRITKGPVDHMPEIKNLFSLGEEENALGQGGLLSRDSNGSLQLGILCGQNSK